MWGQVEGVAKIETAKTTLSKLIRDTSADARIGLMTYGTTSKESCTDVALLNPVGAPRKEVETSITQLTPLGKTPIDLSLTMGIDTLAKTEPSDVQKALVLVSDGIETCDGDPCSVAGMAKSAGVAMKVHVVGFNVDAAARNQLECIAEAGGGQYFDAANPAGFQQAMETVIEVAQAEAAPEPEPKGPTSTEYFRDDFDGSELSEDWAVIGADPDAFLVEDGALLMLSTKASGFEDDEPQNLIMFDRPLPKGDWDAEITFTGEYATNADRLTIGLRKDEGNFISANYFSLATGAGCNKTELALTKASKGEAEHERRLYRANSGQCYASKPLGGENWETVVAEHLEKPVTLTISKRGRAYTAKVEMLGLLDADGNPYVIETDKFTSLRSPGELGFTIDRIGRSGVNGEVLFLIDSVVINEVE